MSFVYPTDFDGDVWEAAERHLGYAGRMVSGSKSSYSRAYPDHVVVFNANVFAGRTKVWYGDVDVTLMAESLQALADECGATIRVLYEMDGRFGEEDDPPLDRAVATYEPA